MMVMFKFVVERAEDKENKYKLKVLDEEGKECRVMAEAVIDLAHLRELVLVVKCGEERRERVFLVLG